MYFLYILYSQELDCYYVGQTDNIKDRLASHRGGKSKFTSRASDWMVVHTEEFLTRKEALVRERAIKRMKSRKYVESLIEK
ncbi:MAG: GIY-YIG nuclease family protein [Cyclobacteriaceae bacterium]